MKRIPFIVMTALLALGVAASAQNEIKIGVYASLTGGQASYGISQNNAIQLGVEEINAAGGVLGKPIKLVVEDDRSTPGESATIVRKLIANELAALVPARLADAWVQQDAGWQRPVAEASDKALAALAGMIAAPLSSVYPGLGGSVLIICFVVVVIGGIGSITGALIASLLIGFVDTFGKVFFAELSGLGVYLLMAVILVWRPEGLVKRNY